MSTIPWAERPPEQARLLNPAFIGALVWSSANGYLGIRARGLPYPLAFVAMPIVLHKATRESLPRAVSTSMVTWLTENTRAHVGFSDRARGLVPLVKDGILFASNGSMLSLADGHLSAAQRPRSVSRFEREASDEVKSCMKRAEFVGKWFAGSGDYATIMALWGVTP